MAVAMQMHPEAAEGHTLVVVFLRGGADGLNMVAPVEDPDYHRLRPTIGVSKREAVALDGFFGLHPRLAALETMYRDGALAILHGTGSDDSTRSHFEAQDLMEHGGTDAGGWIGRWLRQRAASTGPLAAITLGKRSVEAMRGAPASLVMESPESLSFDDPQGRFAAGLRRLYNAESGSLGAAGLSTLEAVAQMSSFSGADYVPAHGAAYGTDKFAGDMALAAQIIKRQLGVNALSIDLDGWDSHFVSGPVMDPLMERLAGGMAAFYQDMGKEMDRCTVVVMTEFGRRAYENASLGTDHGRGGVMFALGGGIQGGRIHADWQGLGEEHLEGPGDLPVAYDYRQVLASILLRHGGIGDARLVFPETFGREINLYV